MSETAWPTLRGIARDVRDHLRDAHRQAVFSRAMRLFLRDPKAAADDIELLSALVFGWGNEGWSGAPEYLRSSIQHALVTEAPMLECGSGLTTLLLGGVAQRTGRQLWSLEHIPEWMERVSVQLATFGIDSVRICLAPLVGLGDYDWYARPVGIESERFGLVVCDGPPANTRGGRYGLVPAMKRNFKDGCVILLDDAEREAEQAAVQRWREEVPCSVTRVGVQKPYFRVVLEDRLPEGRCEAI